MQAGVWGQNPNAIIITLLGPLEPCSPLLKSGAAALTQAVLMLPQPQCKGSFWKQEAM